MDKHAEIAAAYSDGKTLAQCARDFGCVVGTVRHALKKHGIKPRSRTYRSEEFNPPGRSRPSPRARHQNDVPFPQSKQKNDHPVRDEILQYAIAACARLGGVASINDRYAIVDTKKVTVELK